jgi:Cullin binding
MQDDTQATFNAFYKFVFFAARNAERKFIDRARAISLWQSVLLGRFRRLSDLCCYLTSSQQELISEDIWSQVCRETHLSVRWAHYRKHSMFTSHVDSCGAKNLLDSMQRAKLLNGRTAAGA